MHPTISLGLHFSALLTSLFLQAYPHSTIHPQIKSQQFFLTNFTFHPSHHCNSPLALLPAATPAHLSLLSSPHARHSLPDSKDPSSWCFQIWRHRLAAGPLKRGSTAETKPHLLGMGIHPAEPSRALLLVKRWRGCTTLGLSPQPEHDTSCGDSLREGSPQTGATLALLGVMVKLTRAPA